ncbi:TetR family transcriptional regulator [Nocardioides panaciterrulae]|uniref:AcrR family transcriptional regulator n=1 Tax=Nocardioides panaciterrulae TaxID=661492 RepID=A0A7Y9E5M2_9ACTN|nr:TetR family transcriptional regulator [Nocardioides panaciterrulae]NYD41688.1 AcrR family transcriptional regulator [Nocardioides panaciterrulae]
MGGGPGSRASSLTAEELGSPAQRDRRRRILDATIALASGGGFDAVQMRTVAERADVALGTLYRYFPSKIHLLVSALAREFERAEAVTLEKPVPGATAQERVMCLLGRTNANLQRDPHLTEALTRAFMFADATVQDEIRTVGALLTSMLTRAMRPDAAGPTAEDAAIARVIIDVWLSALVGWVTGRSSADEVTEHMDVAVRLLLRD